MSETLGVSFNHVCLLGDSDRLPLSFMHAFGKGVFRFCVLSNDDVGQPLQGRFLALGELPGRYGP